jgi:putative ABC transport system substrate-binding protein
VAQVGFLNTTAPDRSAAPNFQVFAQRLRELGYVEGQNLVIEFRAAQGHLERFPDLAAELVQRQVDVMVAPGNEAALQAALDATRTIPIVMVALDYDPVALGYIAGLPQPGGNITGVVAQHVELAGKRLELLKTAFPQLRRVAVFWDAVSADQLHATEAAAQVLGMQVQALALHHPPAYEYERAFVAAAQEGADALVVLMSPFFLRHRTRLTALAAQHRLPTMFSAAAFMEAGGLMAYGASFEAMFRRAADYVDRILQGTKPGDLPVEQPTKFELVINLTTAKALGITMPSSLLLLADEVIQ